MSMTAFCYPMKRCQRMGEEARKFLQQVTDLGLNMTAAFSEYSHSFTAAIKAVLPQARLQADHCHTMKNS